MTRHSLLSLAGVAALTGACAAIAQDAGPASETATNPAAVPLTIAEPDLTCDGVFAQGGFAICRATLGDGGVVTEVRLNGDRVATTDADGYAFIGFGRDARLDSSIVIDGAAWAADLEKREWSITEVINNLPPAKVTPRTPEQQAEVEADWLTKQEVWKSRADAAHWVGGFIDPIQVPYRLTGVFGSQRILNGEPGRIHNGLDYAAPPGMDPSDFVGTPIVSPAAGTVILADPDMYFEGGFVVVDHGAGVMSLFMHLASVDVELGAEVAQGDLVGTVGSTGRSTGPHLHWGVRVRGTYIDPASVLAFAEADADVDDDG